jgi:hypothetical protein
MWTFCERTLATIGLIVAVSDYNASAQPSNSWIEAESIGVRYAVGGTFGSRFYHQVEATGSATLPLQWEPASEVFLHTALEISGGWITDRVNDGFIGSLGPVARLGWGRIPVFLQVGLSLTLLSETEFEHKDFATPVQFTSHIGLGIDVMKHWRVGYRFQHMSNAHFANPTPGLNLHAIALSYLWK